jgi:hypothetical protein
MCAYICLNIEVKRVSLELVTLKRGRMCEIYFIDVKYIMFYSISRSFHNVHYRALTIKGLHF